MMNVAFWNKRRGNWHSVEGVVKIERYGKTWELYLDGDEHETLDCSAYDLISVDMY